MLPSNCKHCGKGIIFTGSSAQGYATDYVHDNMIRRCRPEDSGQPYGLEADLDIPERKFEEFEIAEKDDKYLTDGTKRILPEPEDLEPDDRWSIFERGHDEWLREELK